MNKIPNRQAICNVLLEHAALDEDIVVLCSDSRGSASMTPFFEQFPKQSIEVGIAEQNLVGIASGLAHCGKKAYCFSPASFLTTRSYEQAKIDVAYSNTNVKLVGISGGISYGALGMSHHSVQDIASMAAIPNMRVYIPSDRFQTAELFVHLLKDTKPAYIRVGRNAVADIYSEACSLELDKAVVKKFGIGKFPKIVLIACGEMVSPAIEAAQALASEGKEVTVLDMYCIKPLDTQTILRETENAELIVTVEEHSLFGGLGSMVASVISSHEPKKIIQLSLPDSHVITGKSQEVFNYYGMNKEGIVDAVNKNIN